jgi:outer membrane protein
MQMKISTILTLIGLIFCSVATGQTLTLDECVERALANNLDYENSNLDVKAAEYRIKEVKSALYPTINVTGQSLYYHELPGQYVPASAFGGADGTYQKITLGMKQNTSATLQMTHEVYNQKVRVGLKAAKTSREAAILQTEVARENLIYNVTATFYSIQILNDNLNGLQENIRNLEKTVEINGTLKDNDLVSANTHSRMLINLENLRNQEENQRVLLEKNYTQLKHLLNLEMDRSIEVEPFNYEELLAVASEEESILRPDIRLQEATVRLAQLDKKSATAGYFPVLVHSATFGYNGFNDSFKPFDAVNDDWVRNSYVSWTLKIPVFSGFQRRNQVRQKQVIIDQQVNRLTMMRSNAEREIADARVNFNTNKKLVANNKKSLDLAEALFTSATSEYENGITSVTELLNAQSDLTDARTNYSNALLNLKLAELSLKKANGTLLTYKP